MDLETREQSKEYTLDTVHYKYSFKYHMDAYCMSSSLVETLAFKKLDQGEEAKAHRAGG